MTHRGGLSLSFITWRIVGGEGQVFFCPGTQKFSWRPCPRVVGYDYHRNYSRAAWNCLQIPEPLFHFLSIGSSCCSHVFMYWLYFLNVECWCSLLVSRGLYMSLDVGFWLLIRFFLIFYHAFKIQSEMTKRCKEAECWTFSGKSTHSSWKIRLLLIIFGTYIQLNRVYICPFVWFLSHGHFEPLNIRTIDPSDYPPFGPMTLGTNEPSDLCPGIAFIGS